MHFHNGAERTGRLTAKIAEEIHGTITSLYKYQPSGKVHFVIRDHDDYSNGAAYYYDNKIEIWATAMDFDLRGSHNWLRNVITHEYTHMIQIGAARKITRRIPAFYVQAIGYEDDKREDVLHGGPNAIASYPLAMTIMPSWFAEGVAQYQLPGLDYDTWDTHRDMILRTATLDGELLSYSEMGGFGKNSLGNEKSYNHGYAFVGYIADNYGVEALRDISKAMKGFFRLTLDGAIRKVTGKKASELYREWAGHLQLKYEKAIQHIADNRVEGELVEANGIGNFNPSWSPNGDKLAYLTTGDNDFLSQTSLVIKELSTDKTTKISLGVRYGIGWSPDGSKLAYAHRKARGKGGSRFYDIYIYDLNRKKEKRLTNGLRAFAPNWSPDGSRLAFVKAHDGTENLGLIELQTNKVTYLTNHKNGEQIVNPQWSPDGKSILFSMFTSSGQDLNLLSLESNQITELVADEFDSRDGSFSPDGKKIYFSWDKTGIFNVYEFDLASGESHPVTNVVGGAFMPSVNRNGELAYSSFTSDGYKIARLSQLAKIDPQNSHSLTQSNGVKLASAGKNLPPYLRKQVGARRDYDDKQIPEYEVNSYKSQYSSLAFLPRAMLDYGTLKLGTYLYSYDVLNKYGFLAGFDINSRGDYDLFALLEYRKFGPTFFFEGYNQVQGTSSKVDSLSLIQRGLFNIDSATDKFKYNLIEANLGVSFKLGATNELKASFIMSRYSATARFQQAVGDAKLSYRYFVGRDISLEFMHRNLAPSLYSDINPSGRTITVGYDREYNRFLVDFATDRIVGIEVFKNYNFNKFTLSWREHRALPLKNHSLNFALDAGFIDTKVDSFFNFFGGGIIGNRGYPYYSIEGRKMVRASATYRFPVFHHLDMQFLHLYFDKVFLGAFYDYGNAFDGGLDFNNFKSSVGAELRLDSYSFYAFPTRIFFNAAYGLDRFANSGVQYGNEWRYYFGISFGYLD